MTTAPAVKSIEDVTTYQNGELVIIKENGSYSLVKNDVIRPLIENAEMISYTGQDTVQFTKGKHAFELDISRNAVEKKLNETKKQTYALLSREDDEIEPEDANILSANSALMHELRNIITVYQRYPAPKFYQSTIRFIPPQTAERKEHGK